MKKFLTSFIVTSIIFLGLYFLIKYYNLGGDLGLDFLSNKYYIIFLYLSIIFFFTLSGNEDGRSKIIIYTILIINVIYLFFSFAVGDIGIDKKLGLIFIGLIVVGFLASLIRHWTSYIIIIPCIIIDFAILFLSIIPKYETGIDITNFEDQFHPSIIISSNIGLNPEKASIIKDKKTYTISEGLVNYELFIDNSGSNIQFKSDNKYQNTFAFLIFKGGEFVQIPPQSAINIDSDYNIEIINGDIGYRPKNPKIFNFTGENTGLLVDNTGNIETLNNRYFEKLKLFMKLEIGSLKLNPTILKISKKTLEFLKIISPEYEENLKNLQQYIDLFDIKLDEHGNYSDGVDTKGITKDLRNNFKNGFNSIN